MADEEHSLLSASGADGWSVCHGKPAMELGRRTTSAYADEGTAAHELAKWVLKDRIAGKRTTAEDFLGQKITVRNKDEQTGKWSERKFTVDEDMAEHIDDYVDRFMLASRGRNAERFCEQRVHYHEYLGVPKGLAWGTSDGVAIVWDQPELEWEGPNGKVQVFPPGDELIIADLKYGMGVIVFADTTQLKLYGAGTYWQWCHVANFTRIRLIIHQPRKDHYDELVISPAELLKAVAALKPVVPRVLEALKIAEAWREENPADSMGPGELLDDKGYLKTSDKGCRFCDAAAICPRMIAENTEVFSGRSVKPDDFDDLTVDGSEEVRSYGGNYLAAAYARLDQIEHWGKSVRAEIDRRVLLKGEKFDGIKVVAGKKGARKWTDKGEAEALARTLPPAIKELVYERKLKTPAQLMDKALKSSPATLVRFSRLVTQDEGKPAVVPASDARKAISHKALIDDFDDLDAEEQAAPSRGVSTAHERHPFR
ncbi:Protein of unknown function DUF2800 [uncultured Caudovirales phage]|uniref:DUF2800 domain-containing protein n=1 Tax=uncultured Caudovirales phage TaxID=2100421 RepID=A0A6J5S1A5_9CAUD|nr:Protein of unknown function DUF2800 [uncultured Caudovirales phage]